MIRGRHPREKRVTLKFKPPAWTRWPGVTQKGEACGATLEINFKDDGGHHVSFKGPEYHHSYPGEAIDRGFRRSSKPHKSGQPRSGYKTQTHTTEARFISSQEPDPPDTCRAKGTTIHSRLSIKSLGYPIQRKFSVYTYVRPQDLINLFVN